MQYKNGGIIMAKNYDEKCADIEQQIHKLQKEKKKILRAKKEEERKHRNHVMILIATHFLTHYPGAEPRLLEMSDSEICAWVDGRFNTRDAGGN